jgi:hypothetical protein
MDKIFQLFSILKSSFLKQGSYPAMMQQAEFPVNGNFW